MEEGIPQWFAELRCPVCKQGLDRTDEEQLSCKAPACGRVYPIIRGVPVLINEDASLFRIGDILDQVERASCRDSKLRELVGRFLPNAAANLKAGENYGKMEGLLLESVKRPKVLIVGGGMIGEGLDTILANREIESIESDVALTLRTTLVCDCHDLPFADGYFDGVVIQAVLEHVVDPYRCVQEIHRALKDGGIIYAEVPFLQDVHGGRYDFTRFTDLGLRRLLRRFEEIDRGAMCGTGMALATVYQAFLRSLVRSRGARNLMSVIGLLSSFWLKYFDYYSINTPASLDAASGLFFMGRKSDVFLDDRDLIGQFRGASGVSS